MCVRIAFALSVVVLWLATQQTLAQIVPSPLSTITTARAAHQLDAREASRAHPVRLRAVVTFYDEYLDSTGTPVLFVTDATGSIYVALKPKPPVPPHPGDLVEIDGVTGAGLFAPIVDHARFTLLGTAPLPPNPPRVILADMVNGRFEGQWVEVEGLVQAVRDSGTHVVLDILLRDGTTTAITARQPGVDYAYLVDAGIVLRGHASPNFNKQKQVTGAHLLFPDLSTIRVVEPGAPDPFNLPIDHISDLLRFDPDRTFQHRVHIRGNLTLLWPGRMVCIQDESQGLCAQTRQSGALELGERVDVAGFPVIGAFTPTFQDAEYRDAGGGLSVASQSVTASQALHGEHDSQLVTVQGWVIDDSGNGTDRVLTLSSGDTVFTVTLPLDPAVTKPRTLANHTLVRVTGICSVQSGGTDLGTGEGFSIPKSFSVLARSLDDIAIIQRPSWWNAQHSLTLLLVVFLVTVVALCGLVLMRRRIKQQTATIRAQLAETHALKEAAEFQATHDGLTGLYNRKAILDFLEREFVRAVRTGALTGIIMLDLDHFKHINDTYGHAAGDDVLRESVKRIASAVRATDWVGRYGGEEFLIVLPECDAKETLTCAERVRLAIAHGEIVAQGARIPVTASLGATVATRSLHSEQEAISTADRALYESKHSGRNRTTFHDLDPKLNPARVASSNPAARAPRVA
jgi:diguanylate cyclase (GGDEF)-like protein